MKLTREEVYKLQELVQEALTKEGDHLWRVINNFTPESYTDGEDRFFNSDVDDFVSDQISSLEERLINTLIGGTTKKSLEKSFAEHLNTRIIRYLVHNEE